MPAPLVVENLVKRYGSVEAVRGVSFEIAAGEVFGLLGPNGAGKTSTVECAIGLRRPDGGRISVCGHDATSDSAAAKERIGAALQSTNLPDKITPREALRLFGAFYQRHLPAEHLIERFSLLEKADSTFDSLSGGERQRLALALAFVNDPELMFLDEPTTGLDAQARRDLHTSIQSMRGEGKTVLLTTHYIEEAELLCDRVAVINGGRVVATGTPAELVASVGAAPTIIARTSRPILHQALAGLTGDLTVEGNRVELRTRQIGPAVVDLVRLIDEGGFELLDLQVRRPTLEDVFVKLTGTRLEPQGQ